MNKHTPIREESFWEWRCRLAEERKREKRMNDLLNGKEPNEDFDYEQSPHSGMNNAEYNS
jgi:hypothetical protein